MKTIALLILFLAPIPQLKSQDIHKDEKYGFMYKYPSGWKYYSNVIGYSSAYTNDTVSVSSVVTLNDIVGYNNAAGEFDPQALIDAGYIDKITRMMRDVYRDVSIPDYGVTDLSNKPALYMTAEYSMSNLGVTTTIRAVQILTVINDTTYTFSFSGNVDYIANYLSEAGMFFDSIMFIPEVLR